MYCPAPCGRLWKDAVLSFEPGVFLEGHRWICGPSGREWNQRLQANKVLRHDTKTLGDTECDTKLNSQFLCEWQDSEQWKRKQPTRQSMEGSKGEKQRWWSQEDSPCAESLLGLCQWHEGVLVVAAIVYYCSCWFSLFWASSVWLWPPCSISSAVSCFMKATFYKFAQHTDCFDFIHIYCQPVKSLTCSWFDSCTGFQASPWKCPSKQLIKSI